VTGTNINTSTNTNKYSIANENSELELARSFKNSKTKSENIHVKSLNFMVAKHSGFMSMLTYRLDSGRVVTVKVRHDTE